MAAIFVTGIGTGIGKTFVTAGLLRHVREQGGEAGGFKPLVSGYESAPGSDPAFLLEAMGRSVSEEAVATIAPFRFKAALSPDMAARAEGREIAFEALVAFCRRAAFSPGTVLIEGVGGVMVPLDATHTTLDLMTVLDLPVVLVAGSYLGSLSHTLTAVAVLKHAGVRVLSLVVNDSGTGEVPLSHTAGTLRRFLPDLAVVTVPRNPRSLDFARAATAILRDAGTGAPGHEIAG